MPIVVNSNVTATVASFNLSRANDALRTSLARLSSGKRIVNPADDAGGCQLPTNWRLNWSVRKRFARTYKTEFLIFRFKMEP